MNFTRIKHIFQLNIFKTIIFNLVFFKLKDAIKFPVLIWGGFKIASYKGKINPLVPIKTGMLKLGISDPVRSYAQKSYFKLEGTLNIGKNIIIRRGMRIHIETTGNVTLENNIVIGDCPTIISKNNIKIQQATRIGNNTTFMDTDFHYIINTETKKIKNNTSPIIIGENNWIGGWCIIKKGTITPKGTIIAGPFSMVSKDYTSIIPEYCLIGGSPAKLIQQNLRRVNNIKNEHLLSDWFKTHNVYICESEIENFCLPEN